MAVNLPKSLYAGLKHLAALSTEDADRFLDALEVATPAMLTVDLGTALANKLAMPEHDAQQIVLFLVGLYTNAESSTSEKDEFLNEVIASAERGGVKPGPDGWQPIKERLARALEFHNSVGVSAKAIDIMVAQANVFASARVLTDIRPVFAPNTDDRPMGALVVHNLKVSYYSGDETLDFYVALDTFDVVQLQDVLNRAVAKEESLEELVKRAGLPRIDKGT